MEKIIKQFTIIIAGGAMALSFGCDLGLVPDETGQGAAGSAGNGGSADFAPDSITDVTLFGTSNPGTGDFDTSGNFTISFTGTTYYLVDSGGLDSGTYTYTKTSNNTGTVVLAETDGAGIVTAVATFTSATAGNYLATGSGEITGQETGSFILD